MCFEQFHYLNNIAHFRQSCNGKSLKKRTIKHIKSNSFTRGILFRDQSFCHSESFSGAPYGRKATRFRAVFRCRKTIFLQRIFFNCCKRRILQLYYFPDHNSRKTSSPVIPTAAKNKGAVSDKGRWFLGRGKTSFREKRSFPLPQTPTLFKKSGVLFCKYSSLP